MRCASTSTNVLRSAESSYECWYGSRTRSRIVAVSSYPSIMTVAWAHDGESIALSTCAQSTQKVKRIVGRLDAFRVLEPSVEATTVFDPLLLPPPPNTTLLRRRRAETQQVIPMSAPSTMRKKRESSRAILNMIRCITAPAASTTLLSDEASSNVIDQHAEGRARLRGGCWSIERKNGGTRTKARRKK